MSGSPGFSAASVRQAAVRTGVQAGHVSLAGDSTCVDSWRQATCSQLATRGGLGPQVRRNLL